MAVVGYAPHKTLQDGCPTLNDGFAFRMQEPLDESKPAAHRCNL